MATDLDLPPARRRRQSSHRAILAATQQLLVERPYREVTIEGIAARAGVGKQTIYRWWPSKAAVILEALNEQIGDVTDFPSTGDLLADLNKQMSGVAKLLASAEFAPYTQGLIPAAQTDPDLAKALLEDMVEPRVQACRERLALAQEEGQLRPDVDLDDVVEMIYAPLYYRLLLHTRPLRPKDVPGILSLAFDGVGVHDK